LVNILSPQTCLGKPRIDVTSRVVLAIRVWRQYLCRSYPLSISLWHSNANKDRVRLVINTKWRYVQLKCKLWITYGTLLKQTIKVRATFLTQHNFSVLWNFNVIEIFTKASFLPRHRQNASPAPNWIDNDVSKPWFV